MGCSSSTQLALVSPSVLEDLLTYTVEASEAPFIQQRGGDTIHIKRRQGIWQRVGLYLANELQAQIKPRNFHIVSVFPISSMFAWGTFPVSLVIFTVKGEASPASSAAYVPDTMPVWTFLNDKKKTTHLSNGKGGSTADLRLSRNAVLTQEEGCSL